MSNRVEELESTVSELRAAVDGLTEELVETRERLRQLENGAGVEVQTRAPEPRGRSGSADDGAEVVEDGADAGAGAAGGTSDGAGAAGETADGADAAGETADACTGAETDEGDTCTGAETDEGDKTPEDEGEDEREESGLDDSDIIVA